MKLTMQTLFGLIVSVVNLVSAFVPTTESIRIRHNSRYANKFEALPTATTRTGEGSPETNSSAAELTTFPTSDPSSPTCRCGVAGFGTGKIIGGSDVDHVWPWFATIVRKDKPNTAHCGASLISSQYILLAAHCLFPMMQVGLRNFQVKLGYHDLSLYDSRTGDYPITTGIEFATIHPRFKSSYPFHFDIGLIKLTDPVICTKYIRPVCLPSSDECIDDEMAITAGFGRTAEGGNQSKTLQQIKIKILSNEECRRHFSKLPYTGPPILNNMLCAWEKGQDACTGDSGGPLFLKRNGTASYIQVGVTSWGIGCAHEHYPGVYARVDKFMEWIRSVAVDLPAL